MSRNEEPTPTNKEGTERVASRREYRCAKSAADRATDKG
jgi:hypothetical protein